MASRRSFIKAGCLHCSAALGIGFLLEGCSSKIPVYKTVADNEGLAIPEAQFADGKQMLLIRTAKLENDILLLKKANGYEALYLQCTHEGVGLTTTNTKIVCTAHGSIFDFEGNVLKEPALKPLKKFTTELRDQKIFIQLI